ncbi:hypothetical protein KIL84_002566 [Mauremys mutica]|uniref:Uncharacterized protein n=1 Tax=Mauremys mutica TaxID=74926 RepID=A0A9D3X7S6_9SAUR|nr:hypothetical protein KIL84_002566 [Mauremys mutica]
MAQTLCGPCSLVRSWPRALSPRRAGCRPSLPECSFHPHCTVSPPRNVPTHRPADHGTPPTCRPQADTLTFLLHGVWVAQRATERRGQARSRLEWSQSHRVTQGLPGLPSFAWPGLSPQRVSSVTHCWHQLLGGLVPCRADGAGILPGIFFNAKQHNECSRGAAWSWTFAGGSRKRVSCRPLIPPNGCKPVGRRRYACAWPPAQTCPAPSTQGSAPVGAQEQGPSPQETKPKLPWRVQVGRSRREWPSVCARKRQSCSRTNTRWANTSKPLPHLVSLTPGPDTAPPLPRNCHATAHHQACTAGFL